MRPDPIAELQGRLRVSWSKETASIWTADNPARGQCSVSALVVQDLLGGDLAKTKVGSAWHFYNQLAGQRLDFTASQFGEAITYDDLPAERSEADTTPEQYAILSQRVETLTRRA
jgi:hypothetical protein